MALGLDERRRRLLAAFVAVEPAWMTLREAASAAGLEPDAGPNGSTVAILLGSRLLRRAGWVRIGERAPLYQATRAGIDEHAALEADQDVDHPTRGAA